MSPSQGKIVVHNAKQGDLESLFDKYGRGDDLVVESSEDDFLGGGKRDNIINGGDGGGQFSVAVNATG